MLGQLIPIGGGDPIPLLKPRLLIGRRSSCDIAFEYPNVSSQHCELELINGYWHLRDLNSSNGTKVNGQRVDERWLKPGDELTIAKQRFEVQYTPDESVPIAVLEDENPFAKSLLEKAGLEDSDRPRRPTNRPKPAPPPPKPKVAGPPDAEDDVLGWLNEDDADGKK